MNPLLQKFLKHFLFVLAGAVVAAALGFVTGDPSFAAFVEAHPALSGLVPFIAGLLGSLSKFIADLDANS